MIQLTHFSYFYPHQSTPAVSQINLHIQAGEFVLLVGESGAGKSTLLRVFNGLVPHFTGGTIHGKATVGGYSVVQDGPQKLSQLVGFVFQNPEAQAVLDVVEAEIAFGLEQAGFSPAEMRLRVEEVLSLLDLTPLRDRPLVELSGGERQRVAIAAVLALRPQVLVLDEPTSQLDPQAAEELLNALVRLNEDLGLTIILAEHRLERVLRYVDRLLVLENGRLVADGPVQEVLPAVKIVPPLVELARHLGWSPVPLSIKEGQKWARQWSAQLPTTPAELLASPAAGGKSLEIEQLQVNYAHPVLKNFSLTLHSGEIVALMGRNGAGKSSLLKALVNLLPHQQGTVRLYGSKTAGQTTAQLCQTIAYLPQNPDDLLFADTVLEELQITWRNHRLPGQPPAGLLAQLGLAGLENAYPRDLSVGQRQRVALAAILVTNPHLILLDEPTRGLDYATKQELVQLWRSWQQAGKTVLLVTHDVELVAQVADRVVILSQGEMIAEGRPGEVLTASPLFAPQIAKLFPQQKWLTTQDVLKYS